MLTTTRRLFKMFLLLSNTNARIDPDKEITFSPPFSAFVAIVHSENTNKRFQNATPLKSEMPRSSARTEKAKEFQRRASACKLRC
jgi:hypothetical protein